MIERIFALITLLSTVGAFTSSRQHVRQIERTVLKYNKEEEFDFDGFSNRLENAYKEWCKAYGDKVDDIWMERFSFHYMVAEQYYKKTGVPVKLNEYAGMTDMEIQAIKEEQDGYDPDQPSLGADFLAIDTSHPRIQNQYDFVDASSTKPATMEDEDSSNSDDRNMPSKEDSFYWFTNPTREDKIARMTSDSLESLSTESILPPDVDDITPSGKYDSRENDTPSPSPFHATSLAVDAAKIGDIDISTISGTGESGRITLSDVETALKERFNDEFNNTGNIEAIAVEDDIKLQSDQLEEVPEKVETLEVFATLLDSDVTNANPNDAIDLSEATVDSPIVEPEAQNRKREEVPVVFATTMALKKARENGVDLSTIEGTGKFGRITLSDVEAVILKTRKDKTQVGATGDSREDNSGDGAKAGRQDLPSWVVNSPSFEGYDEKDAKAGTRRNKRDLPSWVLGEGPSLAPTSIASKFHFNSIFDDDTEAVFDNENEEKSGSSVVEQQKDEQNITDQKKEVVSEDSESTERSGDYSGKLSSWLTEPKSVEHVDGTQISLPELTMYMREAKIIKWLKRVGDPVAAGETILIVECDTKICVKTGEYSDTQEIRALEDGALIAKYSIIGDMVSVGSALGVIGPIEAAAAYIGTDPEPEPITEVDIEDSTDIENHDLIEDVTDSVDPRRDEDPKSLVDASEDDDIVKQTEKKNERMLEILKATSTATTSAPVADSDVYSPVKPGLGSYKATPQVQWEPNRFKMDSLNHVMIPFLEKKVRVIHEQDKDHEMIEDTESDTLESRPSTPIVTKLQDHPSKHEVTKKTTKARDGPSLKIMWDDSSTTRKRKVEMEQEVSQITSLHFPLPLSKNESQRQKRTVKWMKFPRMKWETGYKKFKDIPLEESIIRPVYATPMARVAARKAQLDLSTIKGTGEYGRVTLDDVKIALYPFISKMPLQQTGKDKFSKYSNKNKKPRIPFSTPMARALAEKENIDLSTVSGTGDHGRITVDDIKNAVSLKRHLG